MSDTLPGIAPPSPLAPASPDPAPRFRFYVNGREVTAEEAASVARAEASEMVKRADGGARHKPCRRDHGSRRAVGGERRVEVMLGGAGMDSGAADEVE